MTAGRTCASTSRAPCEAAASTAEWRVADTCAIAAIGAPAAIRTSSASRCIPAIIDPSLLQIFFKRECGPRLQPIAASRGFRRPVAGRGDGAAGPGAARAGLVALHVLVAGVAPAREAVAVDGAHPVAPAGPGPELGEGLVDARELRAADRPAAGGACRRCGADRHGGGESGPGEQAEHAFPR